MSFEHDFELRFIGDFDASVISNASIPNKDSDFQNAIKDAINNIKNVLNIYVGVSEMSTIVQYNQYKYKIILSRS